MEDINKLDRSSVAEPNKTKDEVLAERKARKLAKKQGIKKGDGGDSEEFKTGKKSCPGKGDIKTDTASVVSAPNVEIKTTTGEGVKSKSELRKERRLTQEAQRKAKISSKGIQEGNSEAKKDESVTCKPDGAVKRLAPEPSEVAQCGASISDKTILSIISKPDDSTVPIVPKSATQPLSELDLYKIKINEFAPYFAHLIREVKPLKKSVHPAILKLGTQYEDGIIVGANARCIALMIVLKNVIQDYITPPKKDFSRDLSLRLEFISNFLDSCRPLSISMRNAIKYLRWHVTNIPSEWSDLQAKEDMYKVIDHYIDKINLADEAICEYALHKISDGDVVITYGCSSIVCRILKKAWSIGRRFKVIVIDSRPRCEGIITLRKLVKEGLECSYAMITAASYMMQDATIVLLGAHSLLANGYVVSRAGTSQVALLAQKHNKPVLVCCETHKFSDMVFTDTYTYNELGKVEGMLSMRTTYSPLLPLKTSSSLLMLNLQYDVTPANLVTAVITELGMLPCTSVPVVLRVQHSDMV